MRLIALSTALLGLVLVAGSGRSAAQGTEVCATKGPLVCVSVVSMPDAVPPSSADSPHYILYEVAIANRSGQTVNHTQVTDELPTGTSLVSVTTTLGTCTSGGSTVVCDLGQMPAGAVVTIDIVVTAPVARGLATDKATVSFDEALRDKSGSSAKQDTVSASVDTGIALTSGSAASFVPKGLAVKLTTDASGTGVATTDDPLLANANVPAAPTDLVASVAEVPGPLACPRHVVCRNGDWVQATIPGTFDPALSFPVRWDASLIQSGQNEQNFAVITTDCLSGCALHTVSRVCSSASPAASELPCLFGVDRLADGDYVATLINSHNGFFH